MIELIENYYGAVEKLTFMHDKSKVKRVSIIVEWEKEQH